jgi:hypothetical protein
LKNFVFQTVSTGDAFKVLPTGTKPVGAAKATSLLSLGFKKQIFTDGKYDGNPAPVDQLSVTNAFRIEPAKEEDGVLPYVMIRERSGGACGVHVIGIDGSGYLAAADGSGEA